MIERPISSNITGKNYFGEIGKFWTGTYIRTLKTSTELEPVRHRRERRVGAYMFVCLLAYWLEVALRWRLKQGGVDDDELASYQERLLKELARVQRTVVSLGGQQRTWYLNVTDFIRDGLKKADMKDLLREETS